MTNETDTLCPKAYQGVCYAYFSWIFNDIRYYLHNYKDKTEAKKFKHGFYEIDKIDDPILRHIALYLIENYYEAQKYFRVDGKSENNPACDLLNKWLDNKKSYFTHALYCKGNVHLWDQTIEPLWKKLEVKFKGNNGQSIKWCKRNEVLELTGHHGLGFRGHHELPETLKLPRCYKHVPNEYKCVLPFPPNMCNLANTCTDKEKNIKSYYEKCKKLNGTDVTDFSSMFAKAIANGNSLFKGIDDITFSRQVQKNVDCPSLKYATPISVFLSFFGTLLILFLLKKFTPLGSKLSYRGINKKRLRDNFNQELEYKEYARIMNKNTNRGRKRNNIYYHSEMN